MKATTLFFLMILPVFVFSQNENFTFTKDGLSEYVVVKVDSISENELYSKTLNWVKETYSKPEQVIDATIENESVRFTGRSSFFRIYNAFGDFEDYPVKYTIKISVKRYLDRLEKNFYSLIYTVFKIYKNFPSMASNVFR